MNLLATPRGRLAAFTLLYVGEGLPQGFAVSAVALELKRMGLGAEALGTFAATFMAPWAWKWAMGPFVDNLHLRRFGRRKQWIVATQVGMVATLLLALAAFPHQGPDGTIVGLGLFSSLLLAHNMFAACQDVAIDALAVGALEDHERGRANGLMFGGAQLGMAAGGSGVIALKSLFGFEGAALLVPACLLLLATMVVRLVGERREDDVAAAGVRAAAAEVATYIRTVGSVLRTRTGLLALVLALLPAGGMALSLTVSNVITPTLGMTDDEIATLGAASSLVFAIACVAGGWASDRIGRRVALALFAGGTVLPTAWLAWRFAEAGFLVAPPASPDGSWPRAEAMIRDWWIGGMVFAAFHGLMYGVRSALYMDVAEPRIAATQFTASMALLNVVTMYSYWWQGRAIAPAAEGGWGLTFPQALAADCALGAVFLLVLPFLKARATTPAGEIAA